MTHTISVDTDIEGNLTYDLSEAIIEVIRMASAHPGIILESLIDEYGLPDSVKELAAEDRELVKWYEPCIVPKVSKKILIVYDDTDYAPLIINDVPSSEYWNQLICENKIKQWCYLNDSLKEGYKL